MKPGGIFVCIEGTEDDGHRYIKKAVLMGAKIIIASKFSECSVPLILTDNTKEALSVLVKNFYQKRPKKLIGITGTNGKTSVSYMIDSILKNMGLKTGVLGTLGAYSGDREISLNARTSTTPDIAELYRVLDEMGDGVEALTMEVSSHALSQRRVWGLSFRVGVFTNLTCDHLDYHKTMEEYFLSKRKLFEISKYQVINSDDEYGRRLLKEFKDATSYGIESGDIRALDINLSPNGSEFTLKIGEKTERIYLNIPGEFSIYNALAAATATHILGATIKDIKNGLSNLSGITGRMEKVKVGKINVVIDYAHTPDGLLKVLDTLNKTRHGRLICLFGCGGDRDRTKRAVMGKIATENSDLAVITSDNPRSENPNEIIIDILTGVKGENYIVIPNRREAIFSALSMAASGDTVLLAGKGQETYQIIGKEKYRFDEREIIKDWEEKRG